MSTRDLKNLDELLDEALSRSRGTMIAWYLMASYGYYQCNISILSDARFDKLCKELLKEYDDLNHIHKHVVNKEDLEAGTCFLKYEDYPQRCIDAFSALAYEHGFAKRKRKRKVNKKNV